METLERIKQDAKKLLNPRVDNSSMKMRSGILLDYFTGGGY
jgi:hypothetical protein